MSFTSFTKGLLASRSLEAITSTWPFAGLPESHSLSAASSLDEPVRFSGAQNEATSLRKATSTSASTMPSSRSQSSGRGVPLAVGSRSAGPHPARAAMPSTRRAASLRRLAFHASRARLSASGRPFFGARNSGSRRKTTLRPPNMGSVASSAATSRGLAASIVTRFRSAVPPGTSFAISFSAALRMRNSSPARR